MTLIPDAGSVRQKLRDATAEDHRHVDAIYDAFSLDTPAGYRAFLAAHARALSALEPLGDPHRRRLPLLRADMAALDAKWPQPCALQPGDQDSAGFSWGVRYALEGSRLGGAMLARRVGQDLPKAYLSASHEQGEWKAFQRALDSAAMEGGEGWLDGAVQGARAAFALFAQAGNAERMAAHG